jgi:hypothetical protein
MIPEQDREYTYDQHEANERFARIWWDKGADTWRLECGDRLLQRPVEFHDPEYEYSVILGADAPKGNWEVLVLFGEAWLNRDLSKFTDNLRAGAHHTKVFVSIGYTDLYQEILERILPPEVLVYQIISQFVHQTEPGSSAKAADLEPLRRRAKRYLASID